MFHWRISQQIITFVHFIEINVGNLFFVHCSAGHWSRNRHSYVISFLKHLNSTMDGVDDVLLSERYLPIAHWPYFICWIHIIVATIATTVLSSSHRADVFDFFLAVLVVGWLLLTLPLSLLSLLLFCLISAMILCLLSSIQDSVHRTFKSACFNSFVHIPHFTLVYFIKLNLSLTIRNNRSKITTFSALNWNIET